MSIPIRFFTAAIKKSAVRRYYPDGIAGFRRAYPDAVEDGYVFGLSRRSDNELIETLQRLGDAGLFLIECCAVGNQHVGPIECHPHFEFQTSGTASKRTWEVRLIDDDPNVLAQDGSRLLRHFIRNGWNIPVDMQGDAQ